MNTASETALPDIGMAWGCLDSPDRTDLEFWHEVHRWRALGHAWLGSPESQEEQPLESSTEGPFSGRPGTSFLPEEGMIARTAPMSARSGIHSIRLRPHAHHHIISKFEGILGAGASIQVLLGMAETLLSETARIQETEEGPSFIDYLDDYLNARTRLGHIDRFYQQLVPSRAASGWRNLQRRYHTSPDLPAVITAHFETLRESARTEEEMYAAADDIAEWLAEGTEEQGAAIVDLIPSLPPIGRRILFSACADAELNLTYLPLLRAISRCVSAYDKQLAQAATACLLLCGGAFGKSLLREALRDVTAVPHAQLVQGIIALLDRQ